jgi:catechol 2,3-dioxygenase-like lactoylglutathione lyase family enzyme
VEHINFILYVKNQDKSTAFYRDLLNKKPVLYVKGMTEFQLLDKVKLGLMPNSGIAKIITPKLPHPKLGNGIPRCELYIKVASVKEYIKRAEILNAKLIDPFKLRDWGDAVVYYSDLDGHVIAFAQKIK